MGILPRFTSLQGGLKILYTSATKPQRFIKFIYRSPPLADHGRCIVTYMCLPSHIEEEAGTWHHQVPESARYHYSRAEYDMYLPN